jgi:AcrR family transcriptional regulator
LTAALPEDFVSPRRPIRTEDEIVEATIRAIRRWGPDVTLGQVATEAGLTPARMVQRFGSKEGLLLSVAQHARERAVADLGSAVDRSSSPIAALLEWMTAPSRQVGDPDEVPGYYALLQLHRTDPEFRKANREAYRASQRQIETLLHAAAGAGELVPCDIPDLARSLCEASVGSYYMWMAYRVGALSGEMRRSLESVLRPYRVSKPAAGDRPQAAVRRARRRAGDKAS